MPSDNEQRTMLRCKPGGLARVLDSTIEILIGTVVVVDELRADGSWNVTLEFPVFGFTSRGGRPVVTRNFSFLDESLEPLSREAHDSCSSAGRLLGDHHQQSVCLRIGPAVR